MHLTLKIIAPVEIGGRMPGEEFTVKCTPEGLALDPYWRARLEEEALYKCGAILIVASPVVTPSPEPEPAAPAPAPATRKKASAS